MPGWPTFVEAAAGVNGAGLTVATATITKTGGIANTFDAGASSVQTFAADGFLEFVVTGDPICFVGLSLTDSNVDYTTINYALQIEGLGVMRLRELGVNVGGVTSPYVVGDAFRIERVGTTVRYYRNGENFYTSLTASSGPLRADTAMFAAASQAGSIRLFDATEAEWPALTWQNAANVTVTTGTITARRLTIAGPTLAKAGDHVIAILAGQGPDWIVAKADGWEHVDTFLASTLPRWFAVLRRPFADTDPASYTFDLAADQQALGAIVTYRNLPTGPAAMSATSFQATTGGAAPARTMSRPSDLHLVGAFVNGTVPAYVVAAGSITRADLTATLDGLAARLVVAELFPRIVGASQAGAAFAAVTYGAAFSIALPGFPELGRDLAFSPLVPGAIGLPAKGI